MKSARDIDELVSKLQLRASDRLSERVHGDIDKALTDERQSTHPKIGRRIMISSLTKLAAAAAVILAVMPGLDPDLGRGRGRDRLCTRGRALARSGLL